MTANYNVDKQPASPPPTKIDGYVSPGADTPPPAAAIFNKGAQTIEQIREATERRREHSAALTRQPIGPANRAGGHDSKQK